MSGGLNALTVSDDVSDEVKETVAQVTARILQPLSLSWYKT